MRRIRPWSMSMAASLVFVPIAGAAVPYTMQFETHYINGAPGDAVAGIGGQPDTGFGRFNNTGTTTFSGTFSLTGTAANSQVIALSYVGVLTPGGTLSLVAGPESSNAGGFNKVPGGPDLGLLMSFTGTVTDGGLIENVAFSAYDSEIHSGVSRTNPFGSVLDNYVMQGSDDLGRDCGDDFELSAATGIKIFSQIPTPGAALPLAAAALIAARRRRH